MSWTNWRENHSGLGGLDGSSRKWCVFVAGKSRKLDALHDCLVITTGTNHSAANTGIQKEPFYTEYSRECFFFLLLIVKEMNSRIHLVHDQHLSKRPLQQPDHTPQTSLTQTFRYILFIFQWA